MSPAAASIPFRTALAGLIASALLLAGCARLTEPRPEPELLDRIEIPYTQGVPEERPLPPVRTQGLSDEEINTAGIYRERVRAVVNVTSLSAYRSRLAGPFPVAGSGSGFIIDEAGVVLTNEHVVSGAQRLVVTLYDGSHYRARVLGTDPELDLAVVRFDPQGRELWMIPPGDSDDLQVGQKVVALGNPFGLEGTLTTGVVSALNRPLEMPSGFIIRDLVQTDAAINPGNSGGPLLNRRGEAIGINTMIVSPSAASAGIGLAVPIDAVAPVVAEILETGRVARGWIEIEGIALDARLAAAAGTRARQGILVTHVTPDGNADAAGLRDGRDGRLIRYGPYRIPVAGDVIVAIDGEETATVPELLAALIGTRPGDNVTLTILRDGERREVQLELAARPETPGRAGSE